MSWTMMAKLLASVMVLLPALIILGAVIMLRRIRKRRALNR
jgi:hypothetical protein